MNTTRSRWAAVGAAIAITLGAGGVGISHATTDSADGPVSAFFPIEPCRLAADRAISADSSITLDGWSTTGGCELPDDITGLAANVTAVGATQQTNLRFYAEGDDVPETANLNPTPGAAPTPNAVNIPLNDTNGQFEVYNRFGTVSVYIDVMGYYDDHTHDDRYYTKEEVDAAVAAAAPSLPDTYTKAEVDALIAALAGTASNTGIGASDIPIGSYTTLATVAFDAPNDGAIVTTATSQVFLPSGISVRCRIVLDGTPLEDGLQQVLGGNAWNSFAMTLGASVSAGAHVLTLECQQDNGAVADNQFAQPSLTVVFTSTPL